MVKDSTVAGLCRANDKDIQRGIDALKGAKSWRIHTFIATSALHMEKKLRMTPEQVFEQAKLSVRFAKNACPDVEFSPEDGSRSDPDFLCRVLEAVIKEGATTINIPDTVGYAVPQQFGEFIKSAKRIPNSDKAVWSVHCHNDLGMAVANSLAAVMIGGARQIECTINGLGERAGNTSLEEVVMALRTQKGFFCIEHKNGYDAHRSDLAPGVADHRLRRAAEQGGGRRQRLRARLGHPPGRRAQGARDLRDHARRGRGLEHQQDRARQALGPQRVQAAPEGARHRAGERGGLNKAFQRFKDLADKKAEIFDEDLQALVAQEAGVSTEEHWRLVTMSQASGMGEKPHAEVVLMNKNEERNAEAQGDGPVDATFKAIERLAKSGAELLLYSVNAVTQGTETQGEVTVRLAKGGRIVNGVGADTDIVVASAKAYISALNKLASKVERVNPQYQVQH